MKIIFFGGSFDPLHIGHFAIAKKSLENCDHFIFFPAKQSPHKCSSPIVSDLHRITMLQLIANTLNNAEVDTFELQGKSPSLTWITIQYLKSRYKDASITMAIGEDILDNIKSWYRIDAISRDIAFLCFSRDLSLHSKDKGLNIQYIKDFQYNISSTKIRNLIYNGNYTDIEKMVPKSVYNYIMKNGLYQ